jgi:hypothetical protein
MTKKRLLCACCGRHAGRWVQWHNQDQGCGMCAACADWIVTERQSMTPAEFDSAYGAAGKHRPAAKHDTKGA